MTFEGQTQRFARPEGDEEITPPCVKTRSFDSLSVAHILQTKLDPSAARLSVNVQAGESSPPADPASPSSPSVAAAADALRAVQSHQGLDKAVDCLMSLSALGGSPAGHHSSYGAAAYGAPGHPYTHAPASSSTTKRRRADAVGSYGSTSAESSATRRRLKMKAGPSPLNSNRLSGRSARSGRPVAPVRLLSDASLLQLKLLAAAYKLCPNPSAPQQEAIAARVGISVEMLGQWLNSRQVLQNWVAAQPSLRASDLAALFYSVESVESKAEGVGNGGGV